FETIAVVIRAHLYLNFVLHNNQIYMKPFLFLTFILFSTLNTLAQHRATIPLEKYTELSVYDRISVTLVKGEENKIEISAADKKELSITENDGRLRLKMCSGESNLSTILSLTLFYTDALSVLDANKNSRIISTGLVIGTDLKIEAQDASTITLNIAYNNVSAKSTSGSEIKLSGTSNDQEIMINTGGKLLNKGLKTKNSTVIVLSGGSAEVYASESVIAKVKAGGAITVYGNPKTVDKDDTFGGKIAIVE
ncbi:head GIN domain-containing protein, partial [Maribacter sp.]|uniref:head GIN domain-containing protein n=2 Tax=Maribacter sp. TaxID=1897614 RepID=UPI0025C37EC0